MNLETIVPLVSLIFYGVVMIAALALAIYKVVIKAKNGESVLPDLDKISDTLANIFTKKIIKTGKKNNVTVDTETVKNSMKEAVSSLISVQSIEHEEEKKQ